MTEAFNFVIVSKSFNILVSRLDFGDRRDVILEKRFEIVEKRFKIVQIGFKIVENGCDQGVAFPEFGAQS